MDDECPVSTYQPDCNTCAFRLTSACRKNNLQVNAVVVGAFFVALLLLHFGVFGFRPPTVVIENYQSLLKRQ